MPERGSLKNERKQKKIVNEQNKGNHLIKNKRINFNVIFHHHTFCTHTHTLIAQFSFATNFLKRRQKDGGFDGLRKEGSL
jgi:hypothetical protein